MTPKHPPKLNGWLLLFWIAIAIIIALIVWIAEDASAQDIQHPYIMYWGNGWYPTTFDEFPCKIEFSLWVNLADGSEGWHPDILDNTNHEWDYLIIDRTHSVEHQITYEDGKYDMVTWHTYDLGADGHPHPAGAWRTTCFD